MTGMAYFAASFSICDGGCLAWLSNQRNASAHWPTRVELYKEVGSKRKSIEEKNVHILRLHRAK